MVFRNDKFKRYNAWDDTKMKKTIFLLLLLLVIPLASASAIRQTDSFPQSEWDCSQFGCGGFQDSYLWVSESGCFEYRQTSSNVDVVCADIGDDGDYESCIYDSSADLWDCEELYSQVDDVDPSGLFNVPVLDFSGWGVSDCFFSSNVSLGADFLITSGGGSIAGAIDSDSPQDDIIIEFYEFIDCDDSESERDSNNFDTEEYHIFDKKGVLCEADAPVFYGFSPTNNNHFATGAVCYYEDFYSGEDLSYCDQDLLFNSTDINYDLIDDIYCSLNFTIRHDYLNNRKFNCYNGVFDPNLNETAVDYGGWCGNCSLSFADDSSFELAFVAFDSELGKRTRNNPFDSSFCETGEALGLVPVIIFLSVSVIAVLLVFIGALLFIIYAIFIALLSSGIRQLIVKVINKRNKKK